MNKNSIRKYEQYLDVFTSDRNRLMDVAQIAAENPSFSEQLINAFLDDSGLSLEVVLSPETHQQLFHLYVEAQNARQVSGQNVLAIGYPLLLDVKEEEMLAMPLFIRSIQLQPSKELGRWLIIAQKEEHLRLNPFLEDLLKQNGFEKCRQEVRKLQTKTQLTRSDFLGFINCLSKEMLLGSTGERPTLLSFPSVDELAEMAHAGFIQWSGAIGVFPPVNLIADRTFDILNEKVPSFPLHAFGLKDIDGAKATALKSIKAERVTIVSGAVGSGKTHLLHYLLSNALLKGGKSLVLSPRLNNLKAIQAQLERDGYSSLNFLFQNSYNDAELWENILNARFREKNKTISNTEDKTYQILLHEYLRQKRKMDAAYESTRANIYGHNNWEEIAGLFLKYNAQEEWQLLDSYLQVNDFSFSENELEKIIDAILLARPIFQKLGTIQHPLRNLNAGIFVHQSVEEGKRFVASKVDLYTQKGIELQRKIIIQRNTYADALMAYYSKYYYQLQDQIADISDQVYDFETRYDDDLFDAGRWALKINGLIQKKYKDILLARERMYDDFNALVQEHQRKEYFDFSFEQKPSSLTDFSTQLDAYRQALEGWWQSIGGKVQDELLRLSSKTVQVSLRHLEQPIRALEQELDTYVEELNGTGLYHLPFSANMLTLSKKQKYLEEILGQLDETTYHIRDFDLFFDWQSLWYSLSQEARRVIKALTKVKPGSWSNAFRSWYYHHLLAKHQNPLMPQEIYDLEGLHQAKERLLVQAGTTLNNLWEAKSEAAKTALKTTFKKRAKQLLSTDKPKQMQDLLTDLHEPILDFNPICLSTASQLNNWLGLPDLTFDYLLVDEAQLLEEDVVALFAKAKRVVVFSTLIEETQDEFALTNVLRKQGVKEVVLQRTNNSVEQEMEVRVVSGFYDENTDQNEIEAAELIRLLNDIKKTPSRKLPAVAIVCLTTGQRDSIYQSLLTIKQQRLPGVEMVLQLERNGMLIVTAEELQGQQFDVIIAGLTFHKAAYFLETDLEEWEQLIKVLYQRALNRLIIVHSLSEKEQFLIHKEKERASSIAAILMGNHLHKVAKSEWKESAFVAYLKHILQPHLSEAVLSSEGHYLVVNHQGEEVVILPNGSFSRTLAIDFEEEYNEQIRRLSKGQKIIPVWPVTWWKHEDRAQPKLLAYFLN